MVIPCSTAAWKPAATTTSHLSLWEQWRGSHKAIMANLCLCVKYEMPEACLLSQPVQAPNMPGAPR